MRRILAEIWRFLSESVAALAEDDDPFIRESREWDEKQRRHFSFLGSGRDHVPPKA